MEKQLWRRLSESYEVELQVGEAWVSHKHFDDLGRAQSEAVRMTSDKSVRRTRVCATKTVQTRLLVCEEERPIHVAQPSKLSPTGETVVCRGCGAPKRTVMTDGTTEWVFCTDCSRTYPR